uniref:Ankyrin repeat and ubiquitin domain containing 1 n=1 Tax=Mus musculus TaxID=10090 RepID=A0A0G2JE64_MOUSE
MRIFIAFEGSFEAFDVEAHTSVGAIKQMIKTNKAGGILS